MYKVVEFNEKSWLNQYIDTNTGLRRNEKIGFEKDSFKLMNNSVFGKTIENVRKYRDVKLGTSKVGRNNSVSGTNYHTNNFQKSYYP